MMATVVKLTGTNMGRTAAMGRLHQSSETYEQPFRRLIKWSAIIAGAIFCIHQLAVFTPQPLDAPGTLRPILFRIFNWLLLKYHTPEKLFDAWSTCCASVLYVPPALAMLHYLRLHERVPLPDKVRRFIRSRWLFLTSIAGCLVLCRFPTLLQNQLNVDEGEFLYAAHKLFYDPNFFHAVDCHTSGPLNVYPLMLPAIFGLSPDYASSRTLGLLVIFLSVYVLYRAFELIVSDEIARLAVLPAVAAFCTFGNPELMHMSSEHISLLWISVAIYLGLRVLHVPRLDRLALFLLGFLISATFFSKMQGVAIVLVIAAVAVLYLHSVGHAEKLWKPTLFVVAGAMPLFLLNALLCSIGGVWKDFWIRYIASNWNYPGVEATNLAALLGLVMAASEIRMLTFVALGLGAAFAFQRARLKRTNQATAFYEMVIVAGLAVGIAIFVRETLTAAYLYLAYLGITAAAVYVVVYFRPAHLGLDRIRWLGVLAAASVTTALYVIWAPHRPRVHYGLYLVLPLCTAMAWMLLRQCEFSVARPSNQAGTHTQIVPTQYGTAFAAVLLALTVGYQGYIWKLESFQPFGTTRSEQFKSIGPTIRPPEGDFIRALTAPDAQIRVWGWTAAPYLGSGREGEGKDTHVANCFLKDRFGRYYVNNFLADMQRRPPDLFIDAVGPTSWPLTDPKLYNFEQFPGIAGFVRTNYVHLADLYGQRYFLRRDLSARREALFSKPLAPKTCDTGALGCLEHPITLPNDLPSVQMPEHALLETEFMSVQAQIGPATVFNSEAVPNSYRGFRFQHSKGDRYFLLVGVGDRWATSKEFTLRVGEPVWLTMEFDGNVVKLRCNSQSDELQLPRPMANSPGPINLNSWIGAADPFMGKIQFFQIRDLQKR